jgi:phosphomannomutase
MRFINYIYMSLITSISGLRGTIGGTPGDNLTPVDVVKFTSAFIKLISRRHPGKIKIVVGRDGRLSGLVLKNLVISTLQFSGADVIDLDLATTPTVELLVIREQAQGGIILTASHNPKEWNALKLLNEKGEFISGAEGEELLEIAGTASFNFSGIDDLGKVTSVSDALDYHIKKIIDLPTININAIKDVTFKIVVDGINSVGGIAIPALLKALGVGRVTLINGEATGIFAHNPEPLAENLTEICQRVVAEKADLGIVVDPDVDRLAFIDEQGRMFGEEYTLVAVADYILSQPISSEFKNATVSNLSSSRALRDLALKYQANYQAAAVGEVNVVNKMKEIAAVIGGEGNGGVIYPELHYGRDSLVGTALFLSYLAISGQTASRLRQKYPSYIMVKHKIDLPDRAAVPVLLEKLAAIYKNEQLDQQDGLKIDWPDAWVHLRPSNTEPIMRLYIEAPSQVRADSILKEILANIK